MKTASRTLALVALAACVGCRGTDGRPNEAAPPGSDLERMQGMWEIVAFETARPNEGPGPDKVKAIRLTFTADHLVIAVGPDYRTHFDVTLDPNKDPKRMTVVEVNGSYPTNGATVRSGATQGRPGTAPRVGTAPKGGPVDPLTRSEWLYKFEGEQLVLAVADPGQPPPTDFKPRTFTPASTAKDAAPASPPTGRVDIVRLQKTTVPGTGGPRFGTAYGTSYGGTFRSGTYRSGTFRSTAPSTAKK